TSIWRTSRTQGRNRGSSFPLSSYRVPRIITWPFSLISKCVSRKPQTSKLSASSGPGCGRLCGFMIFAASVELKRATYDRLRRSSSGPGHQSLRPYFIRRRNKQASQDQIGCTHRKLAHFDAPTLVKHDEADDVDGLFTYRRQHHRPEPRRV